MAASDDPVYIALVKRFVEWIEGDCWDSLACWDHPHENGTHPPSFEEINEIWNTEDQLNKEDVAALDLYQKIVALWTVENTLDGLLMDIIEHIGDDLWEEFKETHIDRMPKIAAFLKKNYEL